MDAHCFIHFTATILAQSTDSSRSVLRLMVALAIFLAFVGVVLGALSIYRRKMQATDFRGQDFTLDQLRRLHREGKLTTEEFERAKLNLVGSMHASLLKERKQTKNEEALGAEVKEE